MSKCVDVSDLCRANSRKHAGYFCKKDESAMRGYVLLRAVWKKRKIILFCLAVISTALLACSYHQVIETIHSMKRRAEVRRIMSAYAPDSGCRYKIRGPLAVAQVEHELFGHPLNADGTTPPSESTDFDQTWEKIKNVYGDGDELYFFTSDKRSWRRLNGSRGYVLIRENKVVAWLTTFLN
jgi:hypothetical protein